MDLNYRGLNFIIQKQIKMGLIAHLADRRTVGARAPNCDAVLDEPTPRLRVRRHAYLARKRPDLLLSRGAHCMPAPLARRPEMRRRAASL